MTLWKVVKCYRSGSDVPVYEVLPYNLYGHLKCCYLWYGFKGLKWCYLSKKHAERMAKKLNEGAVR
jgi:hypothetical protein